MKLKAITFLLLATLCVAVVLLSKDLKKQKKQQEYHELRLDGHTDKLINHDKEIEDIIEFLNNLHKNETFLTFKCP